jgi:hypothetical protein
MQYTLTRALIILSLSSALFACETVKPTPTANTASVKKYPLDICIVTDNALGSMGDAIYMNYEGQEVAFCCKPCIKMFNEDPQKYLAKLPAASQ